MRVGGMSFRSGCWESLSVMRGKTTRSRVKVTEKRERIWNERRPDFFYVAELGVAQFSERESQ